MSEELALDFSSINAAEFLKLFQFFAADVLYDTEYEAEIEALVRRITPDEDNYLLADEPLMLNMLAELNRRAELDSAYAEAHQLLQYANPKDYVSIAGLAYNIKV